jgi:hypothetical protein
LIAAGRLKVFTTPLKTSLIITRQIASVDKRSKSWKKELLLVKKASDGSYPEIF